MPFDDSQAVNRIGPAPAADADAINRAFRTPAAVNGSASWTIPGTGIAGAQMGVLPGCWVTITNIGVQNTDLMVVAFWSTSTRGTMANVATAADYVILPGATQDFWCPPGIDTVKFGGPVTAIASHFRSSL